jgi:hypothetical protein
VEELIDQDGKGWNLTLLQEIFNVEERVAIQSVPLSCTNQPDKLVWRGTKNGGFLVSSAYHTVKVQESGFQPKSSNRRWHNALWKEIWNMHSPNVVKNFMRRACKNLLPTKENLLRKKVVVVEPLCPICNLEAETTVHVLWDCPASKDVWGASQRIFQKSTFPGSDFFHVAGALLEKRGGGTFRLFSEISRRIWLRRNIWIYDGLFSHPNNIVGEAKRAVTEYEQVTKDAFESAFFKK